jgi:hypothetical protein
VTASFTPLIVNCRFFFFQPTAAIFWLIWPKTFASMVAALPNIENDYTVGVYRFTFVAFVSFTIA